MKNSWPKPSRGLVVVQDGIGDRPVPSLAHRTPLEAAQTPCMDACIGRGRGGLMDVENGGEVATHTGHLALFGQDSNGLDYKRGPMEACGVGFDLQRDDIALRFNFATVDSQRRILDRRAGRIRDEARLLAASLQEIELEAPVELFFLPATEHRGVLVLRGENLSPHVTDSDPGSLNSHRNVLTVRPKVGARAAIQTAEYLNRIIHRSHEVLDAHPVNRARQRSNRPPANIILTRGAGTSQRYVQLPEKLGVRVACVSGEATVLGLARLCGIETVTSDVMTANLDTDLNAKAEAVAQCLEENDLVYVHLKGSDVAAHDRSPHDKLDFIERTDQMLGTLLPRLYSRFNLYLAFLGDHCTSSLTGDHCADPVPVFLAGEGIASDRVTSYGERSCAHGALGRHSAEQVMTLFFNRIRHVPERVVTTE